MLFDSTRCSNKEKSNLEESQTGCSVTEASPKDQKHGNGEQIVGNHEWRTGGMRARVAKTVVPQIDLC